MGLKLYIDEAGRGPLAGPLYVGVILPIKKFTKKSFKDSKKLSAKQRDKLFADINKLQQKLSVEYTVGIVNNHEVDQWGLTKATNIAILRGIFKILKIYYNMYLRNSLGKGLCSCDILNMYSIDNLLIKRNEEITADDVNQLIKTISETNPIDKIIIDGNHTFGLDKELDTPIETVVKGDDKVAEISMASIVAKVSRDERMIDIAHGQYPEYGFDKHKGYGTQKHRDMIKKKGPTELHRKLFLKNI